jgi:hydroxymethylpyrimidine/phosphomethylpyrimidine kinase
MSRKHHHIVCSIGGSDPTGGAGIQRDLQTLTTQGVEGTAILTALTVQGSAGVESVWPVPVALVAAQFARVRAEVRPAVWKTGMLWSSEVVERLVEGGLGADGTPVVVDPVLAASAGGTLAEASLLEAMRVLLLPVATVVTPNLPEAAQLLGVPAIAPDDVAAAAERLRLLLSPAAVVLKGGHGATADTVVDVVATPEGVVQLETPRVPGPSLHGTGCRHASALAAALAWGADVVGAARAAQAFVAAALSRDGPEG